MVTIGNASVSLRLDDKGRITHLQNLKAGGGNIISRPVALFHAIIQNGNNWEEIAPGADAELTVSASGNQALVHITALNTRKHRFNVEIKLFIALEAEKALFSAEIINHDNVTLTDFYYPCIGAISTLGNGRPGLMYPAGYGEYHTDIISELQMTGGRDTAMLLSGIYPFTLSMQCMMLTDADQCLYLSAQDPEFRVHSLLALGSEAGDVTLEIDKMVFVEPGKTWHSPEYMLWLYRGAWQEGMRAYRQWTDKWRKPVKPAQWIREMNGYLVAAGKQSYGAETWRYAQIPELYEIARRNGLDTLGLYGEFYLDHRDLTGAIEAIPSMGGEAALRQGINDVHAAGGRVVLHYNGHKMEVGSPNYRDIGEKLAIRNHWGNPYYEQYLSFAVSEFIRNFGSHTAVAICPGCEEWQELLARKCAQISALGADGVIFDEVGGLQRYVHQHINAMMPYPCFERAHQHDDPSGAYARGRAQMLSRLRAQVAKQPDFALMIEAASDVFTQYADWVHGTGSHSYTSERDCRHNGGSQPGGKAERALSSKAPAVINMPEMFRHTFPETISTLRNAHPYIEPRMINYALCYGFRFEMELTSLSDKQFAESDMRNEWQAYAREVCAMRKKYADMLLKGDYSCSELVTRANPALNHGLFSSGDRKCLVVWNDTDDKAPFDARDLNVIRWESVSGGGEGAPDGVEANSAAILFLA